MTESFLRNEKYAMQHFPDTHDMNDDMEVRIRHGDFKKLLE